MARVPWPGMPALGALGNPHRLSRAANGAPQSSLDGVNASAPGLRRHSWARGRTSPVGLLLTLEASLMSGAALAVAPARSTRGRWLSSARFTSAALCTLPDGARVASRASSTPTRKTRRGQAGRAVETQSSSLLVQSTSRVEQPQACSRRRRRESVRAAKMPSVATRMPCA